MVDMFVLTQTNSQEWLQVGRVIISEENPNNRDLLVFARENKAKFTNIVENGITQFENIKVSFGLQVKFSIERNEETQYMEHYFEEKEPHVFYRYDKELIEQKFDEFIESINEEVEN